MFSQVQAYVLSQILSFVPCQTKADDPCLARDVDATYLSLSLYMIRSIILLATGVCMLQACSPELERMDAPQYVPVGKARPWHHRAREAVFWHD
jgi:hypothetical protein